MEIVRLPISTTSRQGVDLPEIFISVFISPTMASSAPKLVLYYFPVQARTEAAKFIMSTAKIPYQEVRSFPAFRTSGAEVKPPDAVHLRTQVLINGAAFKAQKEAGKIPFGQLPVMKIGDDGTILADSGAICRYLVRSPLPHD